VHAACENGECRIEPGCFVMGAPRDELGAGRYSNIQVQVTLSRPFLIGQTEVTNEEWASAGWGLPQRDIPNGAQGRLLLGCQGAPLAQRPVTLPLTL
jgi:hypothetical protein